ncbi:uncharacterized protein STEHIDRAFT_116578 [Stereum hirsutum FP-91666 SS1]|uniref:DUF6533 domain-containing protein n=1 Tax=Stereum hirsutum (strain FP-91666) TaxID=721885 RepID=R7RYG2_STEHR|nr:uncharacterized protein STEHIDRAFT_116578 [Stereum hirsutum FP-91666 SS1]EIM79377.1 hypothetical protein STEHIDRAFT_116578 [Stereum hirsutum FP-91666 SS1]
MSTSADITFAQTLWLVENYTILSANTMWLMDFVYTLPMEWRAIWSKKLTGTSILFLLNRYLFLGWSFDFSSILSPLCNESICNIWTKEDYDQLDVILEAITSFLALAFDTIIFMITIMKTYRHGKEMHRLGQLSIVQLLLQDATLAACLEIISIVAQGNVRLTWFKWLNVPTNKAHLYQLSSANSDFEDLTGAYFNVLPNLLIGRLVLNLRLFDQAPNAPSTGHLPGLSFVQNRILGNIGAPLDHSQWDSLMDEEVEGEQDVKQDDIGDRTGNELNTMIPVIYGEESEAIQMVPITRDV